MQIHILIPNSKKKDIEIRVDDIDKDHAIKVIDQKAISQQKVPKLKQKIVPRWNEDSEKCSYCGKELIQPVTGRKKRFCDYECRRLWWNQNRDKVEESPGAIYEFTCKCCGKKFTAYGNKNRQYCSHACYINYRFFNGKRPDDYGDITDYTGDPKIALLEHEENGDLNGNTSN